MNAAEIAASSERVARAMVEARGLEWDKIGYYARNTNLDRARAAMAATREIDAEALHEISAACAFAGDSEASGICTAAD